MTQVHLTVVRGLLRTDSLAENQRTHDTIFEPLRALGTSLGAVGHVAYLNPANLREFVGIDTWKTLEGPRRLFADPSTAAEFEKLFEKPPEVTFWSESGWASFHNGQ
jgi:hypothetical protein